MALWAGIGGPFPGLTTMSVWAPSTQAAPKPCSRNPARWFAASSLSLISFICSHASLIPCFNITNKEVLG